MRLRIIRAPRAAIGGLSYSTSFPANESTISEGGNWTNTVSATFNAPVSTSGGIAFGLNSSGFNDSIAMLVGAYGRDQIITATAYHNGDSGAAEIELHLRMNLFPGSPDTTRTYEIDILPSAAAIAIAKWDGTQGNFDVLNEGGLHDGVVNDGDVFVVSAIGPANNTVLTVTQNGNLIVTYTDTSAHVTGNPGIGFDAGNPTNGGRLGWKDYAVTTSN